MDVLKGRSRPEVYLAPPAPLQRRKKPFFPPYRKFNLRLGKTSRFI